MFDICDNRNSKSIPICDYLDSASLGVCDYREMTSKLIEWIASGLKKPGKTKGGLAKAISPGTHPSVVTRILDGSRRVQTTEIPKIQKYLELSAPPIGTDDEPDPKTGLLPQVRMARVVGEVAAGNWREVVPFAMDPDLPPDFDKWPPVAYVNDDRYPRLPQYAIRITGNSVNAKIPDGHFAIFVPYWEARREITDGDMAVVQRKRSGGLYEGTIKRVTRIKNGWELRPVSNDPEHQQAVPFKEPKRKTDEADVELVGLVIWQVGPV